MTQCPCCSRPLVRCIRHHHQYWFCYHCWAEMPNFDRTHLGPLKFAPKRPYGSPPASTTAMNTATPL